MSRSNVVFDLLLIGAVGLGAWSVWQALMNGASSGGGAPCGAGGAPVGSGGTTSPSSCPTSPAASGGNLIGRWAAAIAKWEGAPAASNNPGNLKFTSLTAGWGASKGRPAADGGSFAQFATPDDGMAALQNFLTLGAQNQLAAFHSARTLESFMTVYAGNPGTGYLNGVAADLGVPLSTPVESFLA